MSQIEGKFDIVLSNFVATDIYVLFNKSVKKICNIIFKTRGGGQRLFEQCSKKLHYWYSRVSLTWTTCFLVNPSVSQF